MARLFETFTAATKLPKFLNPGVAGLSALRSVMFSERWTLLSKLGFVDSFCAIGLAGTHVPFGELPVPPDVEAVESVVVAPGSDVEDVVLDDPLECDPASDFTGL